MHETSSTFDLAFLYVDLGDDFYKYATHMMVQSARKAMPGVRVVHLTDNATKHYPDADRVLASDQRAEKDSICVFKGSAIAEYAAQADRPVIFCDVDLLWYAPPPMPKTGVFLMVRDGFPCMPVNTGLMLSASDHHAKIWWKRYGEVVQDLGKHGMGGWYADQIAAAICAEYRGCEHNWMDSVAPAPAREDESVRTPAVHFKGPRKEWMAGFYRRMT